MTILNQRTLAGSFRMTGTGVHSGASVSIAFHPAEPDTGIRFRRTDLDGSPEIPADLEHVVDTELGTSLGVDGARVQTVEHVLAALAALGIDNAVLELEGPEPPIGDGSFADYLDGLEGVGAVEQEPRARVISVKEPISLRLKSGESYVAAPDDEYRISATIDFTHPAIGRQYGSFALDVERFVADIAPARTFGFKDEAEALHEKGLALGASLENTVVLDEGGVMNPELRFDDEFLRHKVGDIVGDLALLGGRIQGHVVAERPSHRGNIELARALAEHARRTAVDRPIVDVQRIMQHLPHRYPMLLVDRVTEFESGKRIVGIKNVTINEPFFQGHYPGHPIMPGVLVIEAMAQVGGPPAHGHRREPGGQGRVLHVVG